MKKSLKELELSIPTIDIFESRKIIGGYTGWWEGPGGIDNPIMLPEVIVTPGERPDPGYDPKDVNEQVIFGEYDATNQEGGHEDHNYTGLLAELFGAMPDVLKALNITIRFSVKKLNNKYMVDSIMAIWLRVLPF